MVREDKTCDGAAGKADEDCEGFFQAESSEPQKQPDTGPSKADEEFDLGVET